MYGYNDYFFFVFSELLPPLPTDGMCTCTSTCTCIYMYYMYTCIILLVMLPGLGQIH